MDTLPVPVQAKSYVMPGATQPRFASLDVVDKTVSSILDGNQDSKNRLKLKMRKKPVRGWGKWLNAIAWNTLGITALTGVLTNLDTFLEGGRLVKKPGHCHL